MRWRDHVGLALVLSLVTVGGGGGCAARSEGVARELSTLRHRISELEAARQRDNERLEAMTSRLVALESRDRPAVAAEGGVKNRPALPVVRVRPSAAERVVVADSRTGRDGSGEGEEDQEHYESDADDGAPRPLLKLYETPGRPIVSNQDLGGGVSAGAPRRRRSIELASVGERLPVVPIPEVEGVPSLSAVPATLDVDREPAGPPVEDVVSQARSQVGAGQCGPALRSLAEVLRANPEHPLAAEAMLLRARCLRRQGAYLRAIGEIERMARRYPRSGHGAQALLELAESYVALGDIPRAREIFAQVLRRFPRSRAASRATRRVQELGRGRRARED